MHEKARSLALLALLASGWSAAARADRFHYQSVLIGQRAIGLGGAFTGLADDPSAAYYNPGGLAQIPKDGVSVSLSVNAFDQRKIKDALVTEIGSADLVHDGKPSVPVSATMMVKLGKKGADDQRSHAVAFSTFTRDRDDFVFRAALVDQVPGDPTERRGDEVELRAKRSELWYGPSYAYRLSPRWHFGLSAFLSVLRTETEDQITVLQGSAEGEVADSGMPFASPRFRQQLRSTEATGRRLLFRVGALYKSSAQVSLGAMFQTPTIHLHSSGDIEDRIITIAGDQNAGSFSQVKRKLTSVSPDPWELRVGIGYHALPWLHFALDASAYGPTGSASQPLHSVEVRESDDPDDVEPTLSNLYMQRWYRRATGNLSLGVQIEAKRFLDVSAGFFTDFSSAPRIKASSSEYSEPDVDHLGATLACAFHKKRYNVSIGMLALWGTGDGYALHADASPDTAAFTRTTVTDRTFMLFVYGYSRALQRAAEDSYEALKKRREKRDQRAAESDD